MLFLNKIQDYYYRKLYGFLNYFYNMANKKRKPTAVAMIHKVRKVTMKGRFLLVECRNCKERKLVVDKNEATELYGTFACKQ